MLCAVCLCVLALALPCWAFPSGNITTTACEKFHGTSSDPLNAVGEWFVVAVSVSHMPNITITDDRDNYTITIRELKSSQLEQYDELVRSYSKDKLKLELTIRYQHLIYTEIHIVMVPQDEAGNLDAWLTYLREDKTINNQISYQRTIKWNMVDGFLELMMCGNRTSDEYMLLVLSNTATPDNDKLHQAVDKLDIKDMICQN